MGTTAEKLNKLYETKADIKAALQEQGQNPTDVFSTYGGLVRAIQTGVELPTLTNPASSADIAKGYEAIDAEGNVVTGGVFTVDSGSTLSLVGTVNVDEFGNMSANGTFSTDILARSGANATFSLDSSNFGDATAEDVAAGKTFTSAAGLKATGTGEMASTLADELTTQDTLIADIMTALEGKSAASASVETCTVNVSSSITGKYGFTTYKDGAFGAVGGLLSGGLTMTDVVCGSMFVIVQFEEGFPTLTNATRLTYAAAEIEAVTTCICRVDAPAGGTVTVS